MNESIEYNSFEFVKKLINAERYKDYKKDEWGGCDLIIVSNQRYEIRKDSYDAWEKEGSHKLVHNDYAKSIIWLIETLKPYVNYDYLSKYEYYSKIGDLILSLQKTVKDEKQFLLSIVQYLEEQKYDKNLVESYIERNSLRTWYNFGVEHNDPFFVKFLALWMAFNKAYISYPGKYKYYNKKTGKECDKYGAEFAKINEFCDDPQNSIKLESVHEKVFNPSLISIFTEKPVQDIKYKNKYNNVKNDSSHDYYFDLTNKEGIAQTKALLQTIYRVRCNLVHGSKSPEIERDIELVRCSGEIMEIYMKAIM